MAPDNLQTDADVSHTKQTLQLLMERTNINHETETKDY